MSNLTDQWLWNIPCTLQYCYYDQIDLDFVCIIRIRVRRAHAYKDRFSICSILTLQHWILYGLAVLHLYDLKMKNFLKILTHRAFMRFLSSVSSHMNHQHVLSLEWLLLSWTISPLTDETLLVGVDVVIGDMLKIKHYFSDYDGKYFSDYVGKYFSDYFGSKYLDISCMTRWISQTCTIMVILLCRVEMIIIEISRLDMFGLD